MGWELAQPLPSQVTVTGLSATLRKDLAPLLPLLWAHPEISIPGLCTDTPILLEHRAIVRAQGLARPHSQATRHQDCMGEDQDGAWS